MKNHSDDTEGPHGESPDRPRGRREEHRPEHGRHGAKSPRDRRDFWHEWRDERHHHGNGAADIPAGQPLSYKEMEAWREFFHKNFGTWPEEHWLFGGRRFSPWHHGLESFNPFIAILLSKGGGLLPLYVLHLVAQKPRYGSQIMDRLAECTNGQWVFNPGAIYPLLGLLEQEGFVSGRWEDPAKRTIRVYTITPSGEAEVTRIRAILMPKLDATLQVLQVFVTDLQSRTADTEASAATGGSAS